MSPTPEVLVAQLDCLVTLYGKERIGLWQTMARSGDLRPLVDELLVQHYDPAYLKSIERNFSQYAQAEHLVLDVISDAAFARAARHLMA